MTGQIYSYLLIAIGLFTVYGAVAKPNFYWNSRRALRLRKLIGEGGAMLVYLFIGIAVLLLGTLSLLGVIDLIK